MQSVVMAAVPESTNWPLVLFLLGTLVGAIPVVIISLLRKKASRDPAQNLPHKRPFVVIGGVIGRGVLGGSGKEATSCPSCGATLPANAPHGLCPKCLLQQAFSAPEVEAPSKSPGSTGPFAGTAAMPPPEELAQYFPQLEILGLLGQGGMGAVYKARQVKLDRLVALKILPPRAGQDPAFAERFMREARTLARVNHPHIVAVHDFGEAGGMYYFLMEYVDGVNLRQLMQAGRLAPERALPIVGQICDALQYAHEEGIIHRDIKPENILLDQKGRLKIADFGLAKLVGPAPGMFTLTGSQQAMGTPHYMAPEQMEHPQSVDQRADIYSLGVLFYEMLTGELPLGHFALPSQKAAVDERLDAIVLRALERDPERRYQSVSELKTDITGQGPLLGPVAPISVPRLSYQDAVDFEVQRFQVAGPGACLVVTGMLAFVHLTSLLGGWLFEYGTGIPSGREIPGMIGMPLIILLTGAIVLGGRRMMKFESYGLAVISSFLPLVASLPCIFQMVSRGRLGNLDGVVPVLASIPYVFLFGLPVGIWTLQVLHRPEIKLAFAHKAVRTRLSNPSITLPARPVRRKIRSVLGAFRSLVIGSRVQEDPAAQSSTAPTSEGL